MMGGWRRRGADRESAGAPTHLRDAPHRRPGLSGVALRPFLRDRARDLKPGNVWLTKDGTAKLGDFGLAMAVDKTRLSAAGMIVGTLAYMPPSRRLVVSRMPARTSIP